MGTDVDVTMLDAVARATESRRTLPEMVDPLLELLGALTVLVFVSCFSPLGYYIDSPTF